MSADNGIYILETIGEYRVQHLQGVDNLWWDDEEEDYVNHITECVKDNAREMWGDAPTFTNKQDVLVYATELAEQYPILEYGISFIQLDIVF